MTIQSTVVSVCFVGNDQLFYGPMHVSLVIRFLLCTKKSNDIYWHETEKKVNHVSETFGGILGSSFINC